MSAKGAPAKRRRTEETKYDPVQMSENFWFAEGNFVLKAGGTLYRVHRSIFARHSTFFEDMFSIPQPETESETVEGCPVITLSDSEEDIENVLSIFYDNEIDKFRGELSASMVVSMLRLGNKYTITHLEDEALLRLRHDYPRNLTDWDNVRMLSTPWLIEAHEAEDIARVIGIAHEFNLNTILPAAYSAYIIAIQSIKNVTSDDHLPWKAQERCFVGYTEMLKHIKDKGVDTLSPSYFLPAKSCNAAGDCKLRRMKRLPIWETEPLGILQYWHRDYEPHSAQERVCSPCTNEVIKFMAQARTEFWVRLPIFYGLPAWEDLKDG